MIGFLYGLSGYICSSSALPVVSDRLIAARLAKTSSSKAKRTGIDNADRVIAVHLHDNLKSVMRTATAYRHNGGPPNEKTPQRMAYGVLQRQF
jgi:hypothetical protein